MRALRCLFLLMAHPEQVTIRSLIQSNKVSRRTAFRDLALLREAGVSFYYDRRARHFRIADLSGILMRLGAAVWPLSAEESVILFGMLRRAELGGGGGVYSAARRIESKLRACMALRYPQQENIILARSRGMADNNDVLHGSARGAGSDFQHTVNLGGNSTPTSVLDDGLLCLQSPGKVGVERRVARRG